MTHFLDYETGRDPSAPKRSRRPYPVTAPDLFAAPAIAISTNAIRGMVRGDGSIESQVAACRVLGKVTQLQGQILEALAGNGLNDRELEELPIFKTCGPSTVRKRRVELWQAGRLAKAGRRDGMAIWILTPTQVTR